MDYIDYINLNFCEYITITNIHNYLIDTDIIINDDDNFINKIKNYLLKYKRIIAIIFVIILLLIGYYCDYTYLQIKRSFKDDNYILTGGAVGSTFGQKIKTGFSKAGQSIKSGLQKTGRAIKAAPGKAGRAIKAAPGKLGTGLKMAAKKTFALKKPSTVSKIQKSKAAQSISKGVSKVGQVLKTGKMAALKAGVSGTKNFIGNRAQDFKEFSPWFFSIMYTIALTIMGFIIILPSIGFFVVGLICYVILKDKITYIKSL
jgi:hypothetical protein